MRRTVLKTLLQGKLEKSKVSIAVGGKAAFYYLPLTIAEQLGYFKDEGLDVEISDFAGGARALQAVVGGSADVVSGAYEHTINMQARTSPSSPSCCRAARRRSPWACPPRPCPPTSPWPTSRARRSACPRPARPPTWWPTWCCRAPA
jgi:hypothetical protein